jgi:hypothetical protein
VKLAIDAEIVLFSGARSVNLHNRRRLKITQPLPHSCLRSPNYRHLLVEFETRCLSGSRNSRPWGSFLVDVTLAWLGDLFGRSDVVHESLCAINGPLRPNLAAQYLHAKLDWLILDWLIT